MCLPPSVLAWVWRGRFVGVHSHGGWSSTIGDKALCHNLWWVGLPQLETKLNAIICGGLVFHNWRHFFPFSFCHKSWQVLLFVSSKNAYKLAFYEEKRFIPKVSYNSFVLNSLLRAKRAQERREK